jgi:hypothetical protein
MGTLDIEIMVAYHLCPKIRQPAPSREKGTVPKEKKA